MQVQMVVSNLQVDVKRVTKMRSGESMFHLRCGRLNVVHVVLSMRVVV